MAVTSAGKSEQCWISGSLLDLGFCGTVIKIKITSTSWTFEMVQWVKVLSRLQSFLRTLVKVERKPDSTKLFSDLYMFAQIYIITVINNKKELKLYLSSK